MAGSLDSASTGSLDLARGLIRRSPGSGFDATGEQIHNVVDPTSAQDAATMAFVMATAAGMEWQDSVLSYQNDPPIPAPVLGDRYLIGTPTFPNAWTGHDDEIAEWNGVGWDFSIPSPGWVVMADDTAAVWLWSGAAWTDFFVAYFKVDGSKSMTGDLNAGGFVVKNAIALALATGALPAAGATYRGEQRFVAGGLGSRDRIYVCLKSDSGTYAWVEWANGGP